MLRRLLACRNIFGVTGLGFLVIGVIQLVFEVKMGLFRFSESEGCMMIIIGLGLLVVAYVKTLPTDKAGNVDCTW